MLSIDKYWQLVGKIDKFSKDWERDPPMPLDCYPGCDGCCQERFTIYAVESAAIGKAIQNALSRDPLTLMDKDINGCPYLEDSMCLIYNHRPIICRTQGYPITFSDEDGKTVSDICCPGDRERNEVSLPAKYVLDFETLDECLASLNFLYLVEMEEQGIVVPSKVDILDTLRYSLDPEGV
jgi:Fe-S-cluster containining protein